MPTHHGTSNIYEQALCSYGHEQQDRDRFGRIFPDLPPLYLDPRILTELGKANGKMKAAANASPTKTVPVGQVFFGQFIDHDITLDVASSLAAVNDPSQIPNSRTPTLDLDCLYGAGPEAQPYMYKTGGNFESVQFVLGKGPRGTRPGTDLPRFERRRALIGDFRNDENRIVSQIQLGMLKVHNKFAEKLRNDHAELKAPQHRGELFERAREQTTWHYQWAVVHDFLVAMCGQKTVKDVLAGGRHFYDCKKDPFIPVEFSVAAYRFGHSMVPLNIKIRSGGPKEALFGGNLGAFEALKGAHEVVEWPQVFSVGGSTPQTAEKLDAKLAAILLDLPFIPDHDEKSLATRNLLRGQNFLLPSGEQVAAAMKIDQNHIDKVSAAAKALHAQIDGCTPLWLYCLLEGSVLGRGGVAAHKGEGLGPVGGRITAEVIIGLLECDSRSFLSTNRNWKPDTGLETIGELLEWAS